MSWFFGKSQKTGSHASLDQARKLLWQQDADGAIAMLSSLPIEDASVALAYRSLAHRMKLQLPKALADANQAVAADPSALEPKAALCAAALTNKDVVAAATVFSELKTARARDAEGHFLHLLCFVLLGDCIANMQADSESINLDFRLTPAAQAAVCIFDGLHLRALHDLSKSADNTFLCLLAGALASYRQGQRRSAANMLDSCAGYAANRDPFHVLPALQAVAAEARRQA
jgi:hypothetical protein